MMAASLVKSSFVYTVSQIASRGVQVLALIVFPLFLTPAEYGVFGLIAAISALVNVTVALEVTQGLARYYASAETASRAGYVSSAWWFTSAMVLAASVPALVFAEPLTVAVFGELALTGVFRIATVFFAANVLFYFIQSQMRWEFRIWDYAAISLGFALLTFVLAVVLALSMRETLQGTILGQALGALLVVLIGIWRLRHSLFQSFAAEKLKAMLRFSLPLVPANIAMFASIYGGRLIVNDKLSLAEVGMYTLGSQIAALPSIVLLGLNAAVTPYVMAHFKEPQTAETLARLCEATLAVGISIAVFFGLFASDLLARFWDPGYAGAGSVVLILAIALYCQQLYIFFPGFAIGRRTDLQLVVSLASAACVIGTNYLLIGPLGIVGAALATLVAVVAFLCGWIITGRRFYAVPVRWRQVGIFLLAVTGIVLLNETVRPGLVVRVAMVGALPVLSFALRLITSEQIGIFLGSILRPRDLSRS